MTKYLYDNGIKIFDYAKYSDGLRKTLREQTETVYRDNNVEIQYINASKTRRESPVSAIPEKRGTLSYLRMIANPVNPVKKSFKDAK
jgi:hypothetical protein